MDDRDVYRDACSHALAGFQLVEAKLKDYIGSYYDAVRLLLKDRLPFYFQQSDINEAAFEKLLGIFSKINSNAELLKELRSLVKRRNDLAHKALTDLYNPDKTVEEFNKMTNECLVVAKTLGELLEAINNETLALRAAHKDS